MKVDSKTFKRQEFLVGLFLRQGGYCDFCKEPMSMSFQDMKALVDRRRFAAILNRKKYGKPHVLVHCECANGATEKEVRERENARRMVKMEDAFQA